ncbi:hypothetical protein [Jannaschia aquimarina]|uniref:Uncharacterized protein n=1 Tax=Jannaschia aquimarina TaxID=935700 RepID=A0A0D1D3N2_9RHOB|nr:hypothetical protein [Jannaschia aquimarina]KIT14713.1 hypothetical protein jaqu_35750 [Jannaschia aquimarina]SNT39770.1 hypothetical protein SAMN05421775_1156 [Jannaschia aquimarina]
MRRAVEALLDDPIVGISDAELRYLPFFDIALSEDTREARLRAIENVRYEVIAASPAEVLDPDGPDWLTSSSLVRTMRAAAGRVEEIDTAAREFAETVRRYEAGAERRLNIARETGLLVVRSILEGTFRGVHSETGILTDIEAIGRAEAIRGARDQDTLRKIWKTYRGVIHLGLALMDFDDDPEVSPVVLARAENYRRLLSENCPRGTSKPYVDPSAQLIFRYMTRLKPPRF